MNDPNGPLWFDGWYHIFYQHNPFGDTWATMHWGHARSRDLVNWEHLPIALAPSNELGETHCFSGCAVLDNDVPAIMYTSIGDGERNAHSGAEQWLAHSHDGMLTWKKRPTPALTNAIHTQSRLGEMVLEWRDPFIWRENNEWHLVLGGGFRGRGCIALYRSSNLTDWRFINILLESSDYPFLECPNLLRFGDKTLLFYSPNSDVVYHLGMIDDKGRLNVESTGILDYGGRPGFYAPNTLLNDPKGRYICWGWCPEPSRNGQGYSGALSLPRTLTLSSRGELLQSPVEELESCFSDAVEQETFSLNGGEKAFITRGRELKLELNVKNSVAADDFFINFYKSPKGEECSRIRYCGETGEITLERGLTNCLGASVQDFQRARLAKTSDLSLEIFLDHSLVEIFANKRVTLSGRVYPGLTESEGISVSGRLGEATLLISKWKK
jgi:beta-fructofuranosidase